MRRGRYCLTAGDAAAGSGTAERLTTPRERRLEKGKQSDGEGEGEGGHIHLALGAVAPGSCWKMKNYMALIRLHYRTSDYMRLTRVQKKPPAPPRKKEKEEGNIHDLINYAIMWYLLWL